MSASALRRCVSASALARVQASKAPSMSPSLNCTVELFSNRPDSWKSVEQLPCQLTRRLEISSLSGQLTFQHLGAQILGAILAIVPTYGSYEGTYFGCRRNNSVSE